MVVDCMIMCTDLEIINIFQWWLGGIVQCIYLPSLPGEDIVYISSVIGVSLVI